MKAVIVIYLLDAHDKPMMILLQWLFQRQRSLELNPKATTAATMVLQTWIHYGGNIVPTCHLEHVGMIQ